MSDTGCQSPSPTGITSGISEDRLKKGVVVAPPRSTASPPATPGDFVVRIPKSQTQVSVRLNTRAMVERREIERANEAIRKSGR